MKDKRLKQIREAERISHMEMYSDVKLYEKGSWLPMLPGNSFLDNKKF